LNIAAAANPIRATLYVLRDITLASFLVKAASSIASLESIDYYGLITSFRAKLVLRISLWVIYWFLQGLVFAGIFCLGEHAVIWMLSYTRTVSGHDAGHGSLYEHRYTNNLVGFLLHTVYFNHMSLDGIKVPCSSCSSLTSLGK